MHTQLACFFSFLFLMVSTVRLHGQRIINEKIFPVDGYSVLEQGYPVKVAPATNGAFVFLEYWAEGVEGHRTSNYYLQNYGIHNFAENWFRPLTQEGYEEMQIADLQRMEDGYVVLGYQYISELREAHAVGRFFDAAGQPIEDAPIQLSNYDKAPAKNFDDRFVMSFKRNLVMWMGQTSQELFLTVRRSNGKLLWEKVLEIPELHAKYEVSSVVLDDLGNPLFLMNPAKLTYTARDSLTPPVLMRYLHEKDSLIIENVIVNTPGYLVNTQLGQMSKDEIVVTGVLASGSGIGLSNGAKIDKLPKLWTHVFFRRYKLDQGIRQTVSAVSPIPEKLTTYYAEAGANFSRAQLVLDNESAALLFEEYFTQKDRAYFYDIACMGFDVSSGTQTWSRIIRKKQRGSGNSVAFLGYVAGVARDRLRVVYLTERGAPGKIMCASIDMRSGERRDKMLASNEEARYLFFPARSGMVSGGEMVLIGMGNPDQNDFKLVTIGF
jgi:hypothetical protein